MSKYPTGIENHGGSLRLWFMYEGERVRENLGLPDKPKKQENSGGIEDVDLLRDQDRNIRLLIAIS